MTDIDIFAVLAQHTVVPVIVVDDPSAALPLADALIGGGLPVAEITFRTPAAPEVISAIRKHRPQVVLGAGTVLTAADARRAKDCGASFAVAPGFNPQVAAEALRIGLPFAPGVMTPSEIEQALAADCRMLKFFPAEAAGGVKMLEALSAPYAHTGVKFMPTGGVSPANLGDYLRLKTVLAVGGTWIARREDVAGGNWAKIRENAKAAAEAVKTMNRGA